MRKYIVIFLLSWQNGLVYRVNLLTWRFRSFLSTLTSLSVWSVIFAQQTTAFSYQESAMSSYIILISILQSFVFATTLHGLAQEIYSGNITQQLLKPQKPFLSFVAVEAADKLRNLFFCLLEAVALFLLFRPQLVFPSLSHFGLFLIWTALGTILYFYITILFGTLGFWSPQSWAPKFLFFIFLEFTAGKLFPLDILPTLAQKVVMATPFPYMTYIQTQLFLERLSPTQLVYHSLMLVAWTGTMAVITTWIWRRGIKDYAAAGL